MADRLLALIVLLVLSTPVALAQKIYKWKDEKGQWYFSDTPLPGVTLEKTKQVETRQKLVPAESEHPAPASDTDDESMRKIVSSPPDEHTSDVPPSESASGWLFITPPITRDRLHTDKPLSEWTVRKTFQGKAECEKSRKHIIKLLKNRQNIGIKSPYGFGLYVKSRCIASDSVKSDK